MKYSYEFDFGPKPAFIYDAWFIKTIFPIGIIALVFFPLTYIVGGVLASVLASIAAGAIILFFGIYLHRRSIAVKRIGSIDDTVFRYELNGDGIVYKNELGQGIIKWGFKAKIVKASGFYILQSNEIGMLPLPVEIPDDLLAFVREKTSAGRNLLV